MRAYLLLIFFCISLNTFSQQKSFKSIGFGYSPITNPKINITSANQLFDEFDFEGNTSSAFNVFYESQILGITSLFEATYLTSGVDVDIPQELGEGISEISLYKLDYYGGYTINKQKRIQFPLYIGLGLAYLQNDNELLSSLMFDFGAIARMKFYVTNKIALYVGASYNHSYAKKEIEQEDSSIKGDLQINIGDPKVNAGIIISI